MKRALGMAAIAASMAWLAAAQETATAEARARLEKMLAEAKLVGAKSAVMGPPVKNAPYSGEEISESTQVLADGNRIHRESHTMVYRDSEGRLRRETPESITIWDPVTHASFMVSAKDQV